jgi:hypothetical protein
MVSIYSLPFSKDLATRDQSNLARTLLLYFLKVHLIVVPHLCFGVLSELLPTGPFNVLYAFITSPCVLYIRVYKIYTSPRNLLYLINPRKGCVRRRGRPRKTWRRTIEEEITEMAKTWREVKALANQRKRWRSITGALCSIRN